MSSGKPRPRQSRRTQRSSIRRSANTSRDPSTSSPTRMRRVHPEQTSRNSQDRRSSRGERRSDDQNPPDEQEQSDPPDQSSGSSDPRSRRTSERRTRSAHGSSDGQSWPVNADGEPRSPFARKMDQDIARQCFGASSEQDIRQQTPYERRQTMEDTPAPPRSSTRRPSTAGAKPQSRSNSDAMRASRAAESEPEAGPSQRPTQLKRYESREFGQPVSEDVEQNKLDERDVTSKPGRFPKDWFLCNLALLILMILCIAIGVWIAILNKTNGVFAKKRSNYV